MRLSERESEIPSVNLGAAAAAWGLGRRVVSQSAVLHARGASLLSLWATLPRSPADQTIADPMRVVRRGAVHHDATTAAAASASARRLVIVRLIVLLLLSVRALLGSCGGRLLRARCNTFRAAALLLGGCHGLRFDHGLDLLC